VETLRRHTPFRVCNIDIASPVIHCSAYPPELANILNRLGDLASRLRTDVPPRTPRRQRNRRHTTEGRVATPSASRAFVSPRRNTSSSSAPSPIRVVPNRDILSANQANPNEPHYPAISGYSPRPNQVNVAPRAPVLPIIEHSSDEVEIRTVPASELHAFYPEYTFLSGTLPTRNYRELVQFFEHCQNLIIGQSIVHVNHPLARLQDITNTPLNFVNFLWRVQVTITHSGIVERFSYIRRRVRRGQPDRAILEPAFDISYTWSSHIWTVTPVTPR